MCGIAGFSGSIVNPYSKLLVSLDAISHRGPDDSGVFFDEQNQVGLVHTRLSIQDLSPLGHQPMSNSDGSVMIVFNGEIYNFKDLREQLASCGFTFVGQSDTEVLLNLYLFYRDSSDISDMLNRVNGIFSFAIWDSGRDLLCVARDAFGVKPLYYFSNHSCFAFASEIKSLLSIVDTPQDIDYPALDRYLTYLWSPGVSTPALHIKKVGPGEAFLIRKGLVEKCFRWYDRPNFTFLSNSDTDHVARSTADHLRTAIHRQMVSDVPVGAFLSGGLDSSSVVAFARELVSDLQCFTINLSGCGADGFADDLPYAREVANYLGVPLQVAQVDASQMANDLEYMVWQLDEPLADPASLNVFYISRLAREQGINVLLSGAGGDDLFSGYRRHLALKNEKWWRFLPRPLRSQLRSLTGSFSSSHPLTRRLRKAFSGAHLDGDARLVHYFRWIERSDLSNLYTSAFRSALGEVRAEDSMLDFLADLPSDMPALERMLSLEQRFFLTDHNLTYTDKMSMSVGVEVRVPFLDPDLVKFASRIPPGLKQRGRQSKWILKKAMEPYLPKDVIYRPKSGFGAPLRSWLKYELRDWLADTLSVDRLHRRGLFDPHAVQRLIADNAQGRIDASYTLLSLACIEIWCKYFFDGAPSPSLNSQMVDS